MNKKEKQTKKMDQHSHMINIGSENEEEKVTKRNELDLSKKEKSTRNTHTHTRQTNRIRITKREKTRHGKFFCLLLFACRKTDK